MCTWNICKIEEKHPLVHCITNGVTVNDCANAVLAFGASPTMAHHIMEVEEVTAGCDALVLNLGATDDYEAMEKACRTAKKLEHPIVLDPVGAGGSSYRRNFAQKLLKEGFITCIRGNRAEISALASGKATQTGVDAGKAFAQESLADWQKMAEKMADRFDTIVIISGVTDIVSDGKNTYAVDNGSAWMTRITGSGCMSSAVLGAFLGAEGMGITEQSAEADIMLNQGIMQQDVQGQRIQGRLLAALTAVCAMGICGELAEESTIRSTGGTMTFHRNMLDVMSKLNQNVISKNKKVKKLK